MPKKQSTLIDRILGFRFLFIVNTVILVLLGLSFGREFIRNYEIGKDIDALEAQASALEAKNIDLLELRTAFQTESFIEREARLKLGMKKPGEEVVVVQYADKSEVAEPQLLTDEERFQEDPIEYLEDEPAQSLSNPEKWIKYFFAHNEYESLK